VKVFNHGPHVILDLLSCGLWLPVHLLLWACAPTVPLGGGAASSAAAAGSANTTIVFGGQGPQPQVFQAGHPQVAAYPYAQQPQMAQPYQPAPVPQRAAHPPAWAIEEARERLPVDAPWDAVASMAWEYVQRREREASTPELENGGSTS
jgi:hypothetical protein